MTGGELVWAIEPRADAWIVVPAGRVDESTATGFGERLAQEVGAAAFAGVLRLAIDLAGIDYMSSRGLRGLTLAQRRATEAGVTIVLAQPNEIMQEILAISRYDMVFKVFDTVDQATSA